MRAGQPDKEILRGFFPVEQDGVTIWLHKKIKPTEASNPMSIGVYRLLFLLPVLFLRNVSVEGETIA